MKLYENNPESNYETVSQMMPCWYKDVREMEAILRAKGRCLDDVRAGLIQSIDNQFVMYSNAQTVRTLELFYEIPFNPERSLDERKRIILAKIAGRGKVGSKEIVELLSAYVDGRISVTFRFGTIIIRAKYTLDKPDAWAALNERIPAHLGYEFIPHTRSWKTIHQQHKSWEDVHKKNEHWLEVHLGVACYMVKNDKSKHLIKLSGGKYLKKREV